MTERNKSERLESEELTLLKNNLRKRHTVQLRKLLFNIGLFAGSALYRTLEIILGMTGVVFVCLPLFFILAVRKVFSGRKIFISQNVIGKGGVQITVRYFNVDWSPLAAFGLLLAVVRGDLSFVGSTLVNIDERAGQPMGNYLSDQRPGVLSLWNLRAGSKIGHEGFMATEWEYCFTKNFASDMFIALRSIPAYFFRSSRQEQSASVTLLGISFDNITMKEAVDLIHSEIETKSEARTFYFVNADCLNKSYRDAQYSTILKNANHVLPDGVGINIACKMIGRALRENINGTDMLPYLCRVAAREQYSIYLLGGRQGVAEKMADRIEAEFAVKIAGTHHGYFDHARGSEGIVDQVNQSGADILLVAFGAPLQERWIAANRSRIKAGACLGVGGLFDFYSGTTRRAPRWLRELGLEWVYRMMQEPGRMWHRYVVGNPLFLYRVLAWQAREKNTSKETKQ